MTSSLLNKHGNLFGNSMPTASPVPTWEKGWGKHTINLLRLIYFHPYAPHFFLFLYIATSSPHCLQASEKSPTALLSDLIRGELFYGHVCDPMLHRGKIN